MNIIAENISKSFDHKNKVLDGLNLEVEDGSLTTLLGLSGCGKTTFLRILAGLESSDSGTIKFGDSIVFDKEKKINRQPFERNVSFVFQDFALWPNMNVLQNVMFALSNRQKKRNLLNRIKDYRKEKETIKEKSMEALKMVKMEGYADRMVNELSGGQKQRIAIARAIVISPDVIFFDEPLSALDALLRQQMRVEIQNLVKRLHTTAIFVTHDQEEAMAISDKIIIMNQGRIEEMNTPEEIYWNPKRKFVAKFIGKASFLDDTHFLRPENLSFVPNENEVHVKAVQCTYEGGNYDIQGEDKDGRIFFFSSDHRISLDENLTLYYSSKFVKEVK